MRYTKRMLTAAMLLAWGGFLMWMVVSGSIARFLGPRTYWVAWFGAATLSLAGLMTALHAIRYRSPQAGRADWAGVVLLALPIALVLVLPSPRLGAQAASRKAVGAGVLSSFAPRPSDGGDIGLEEIYYAGISGEYAEQVGIAEGAEVELTGFVTHPKTAESGTFSLTRFYISCCAADAVPYSVPVDAAEDLDDDTWLEITGTLARGAGGFIVKPTRIEEVEEPSTPYLY